MIALRFLTNLAISLTPTALLGMWCFTMSKASRDEWKLLAWVPVTPLLLWGVYLGVEVTRDPRSHNLWPFDLVVFAAMSLILVGLFLIARRVFGGPRNDWTNRHGHG